jgi:RNA polymerase sigma factor (sigma-70 family)
MSANDTLLFERWRQRGDAEAFAEIVSRYSAMVYATCRRVLQNSEDAQDAAQECFIELMRARVDPSSTLGPWLHTVAVRRSLDRFKSARRRVQRELNNPQAQESVRAEPETEELLAVIDEAIAALPDALRVLIVGRFLERRTHDSLAEEQNISESAARYRINNGIEQIRAFLKRRGVIVSEFALGAAMGGHLVEAAPATLTISLGKLALGGVPPSIEFALYEAPKSVARNTGSAWNAGALLAAVVIVTAVMAGLTLRSFRPPQDGPRIAAAVGVHHEPRNRAENPGRAQPKAPSTDESVPPPAPTAVGDPAVSIPEAPVPAGKPRDQKPSDPCTLSGTISDSTGQGISGARVSAAAWQSGYDYRTMVVWHGETDAGGQYTVTDIELGQHGFTDISVSATGFQTDGKRIDMKAGEERAGVDFTLSEGVNLDGRVLDASGNPVTGAAVACRSTAGPLGFSTTNYHVAATDADGAFTMGFRSDGIASLLVIPPGKPESFFPGVPIGEPKTVTLTLTRAAHLSGTVTYPDGAPAAGVSIMLIARYAPDGGVPDYAAHVESHEESEIAMAYSRPASTGPDGSYAFMNLPAVPDVVLEFDKAPEGESVTFVKLFKEDAGPLAPGENKTWNCTLPSDGEMMTIRGRVLGLRSGKPLEASIAYENTKTRESSMVVLDPGNDGAYELKLNSPASYELWGRYMVGTLETGRKETSQTIPWAAGTTRIVDFRLPDPFALSIRVVDTAGQPVEGANVDGTQGVFRPKYKTDEEGRYEWDGFAPGMEAHFTVTKDGYRTAESQRITGESGAVYPEETVLLHRVDEPEVVEPTPPAAPYPTPVE